MQASIKLNVGTQIITVDPNNLKSSNIESVQKDLQSLPSGEAKLIASHVATLTLDQQVALWQIVQQIRQQRPVSIVLDKVEYASHIDAAVSLIPAQLTSASEDQQVQVVLLLLKDSLPLEEEAGIDALMKGLKKRNVTVKSSTLKAELKQLRNGAAASEEKFEPTAAAKRYLAHLRLQQKLKADVPVLRFWGGEFYRYVDCCWKPIPESDFEGCVGRFLQGLTARASVTKANITNVVANLKSLVVLDCSGEPMPFYVTNAGPPTQIEERDYTVFQNGILDIGKIIPGMAPKLLSHDRGYFSQIALPFDYDPAAKCPGWMQFLNRVLEIDSKTKRPIRDGDNRLKVLQEVFGYCLLPDSRFQKFLIMVGEGANGKSVIEHLLVKMLGEANVSHQGLDQFAGSFALQPLLGKMANICGDLNEIDSCQEGILKRLTGEDNLTVNRKNLPFITMRPNLKFVFACNSLPRFRDRSDGLWRRLIAMPFNVQIPADEQDPMLAVSLEEELPGILNWAIRGLQRLLQQGGFTACPACEAAKEQHQLDCDPFQQFLNECVDFNPRFHVAKPMLYACYVDWCEENGRKPAGSSVVSTTLKKIKGVSEGRPRQDKEWEDLLGGGKRPRLWYGLTLADEAGKGHEARRSRNGSYSHAGYSKAS